MRKQILATLLLLNTTFSFAQEKYVFEKPEFKIKINLNQPFKIDDFTNQNQSGFFGQTNESLFSADICNKPECWYIEVTKGYENFTVFSNRVEDIKKNSTENLKNYIVKKDNNVYEIVLNQYGLMYTKVFKYNGNTVLVYMRCYQCNDDLELVKKTFNERFINE
ncbi:hypothetical protein [Flavobacterium sp.]|jgi:hypothetical protein|uniref:hypothetical protein n=1 Tax=Flavobacterium sp. TaxID=239 RepID=UPI0037C00FE7